MNYQKVEFKLSAAKASQFPRDGVPQIAFAGKSNVGKSSVINRVLQRKNLAYVGSSPGKTIHINYFLVDETAYLVDLPGYGYAKVSQTEKEKWGKLIENYLHKSSVLKAVFLLIDIRHETSANDKLMYDWIVSNGFDPVIIATKLDKIKRSQTQKQLKLVRTGLGVKPGTVIIPFSAETKQGRDEIWAYIEGLMKTPS